MSGSEKNTEINGSDGTSVGAIIQMIRSIIEAGGISVDQLAILKANLPKVLDHLKDASKSDEQAMRNYLDFLIKSREISTGVITQRLDLITELLDKEKDPDLRKMFQEELRKLLEEERLDREHARSEGARVEKETRGFRKASLQTAIKLFCCAVVVAGGIGTVGVVALSKKEKT